MYGKNGDGFRMTLKMTLKLCRVLYCFCFALAALGIVAECFVPLLGTIILAGCFFILVTLVFVTALYNRCPQCGHVIKIKPLKNINRCSLCNYQF